MTKTYAQVASPVETRSKTKADGMSTRSKAKATGTTFTSIPNYKTTRSTTSTPTKSNLKPPPKAKDSSDDDKKPAAKPSKSKDPDDGDKKPAAKPTKSTKKAPPDPIEQRSDASDDGQQPGGDPDDPSESDGDYEPSDPDDDSSDPSDDSEPEQEERRVRRQRIQPRVRFQLYLSGGNRILRPNVSNDMKTFKSGSEALDAKFDLSTKDMRLFCQKYEFGR